MRKIALIPARGGSKGILKKNITPFCGRPLITYTIETAINSQVFDRVIVNTDDAEIAQVARQNGAEVPFIRPPELAQDTTKDFPVFEHTLRWLEENEGYKADLVIHLRPTSPLRLPGDILRIIEKITSVECDSVRSVCEVLNHPYYMIRLQDDNVFPLLPAEAPVVARRRQELPPFYMFNGLVDAIWTKTILEKHSMYGTEIKVVLFPQARSYEIDNPLDLIITECIYKTDLWKSP